MKETIIRTGFLILCVAMCLTLSVGILFAGPSKAGANEQLGDFPSVTTKEGSLNTQWPSQFSQWLQEHFFLRQTLISVDHWIDGTVFKTSGDPGVLLGSDGWLYYADTLEDYTGTAPMSERELFAAARNLALMARYCEENGRQFLFTIAPNKNSLYNAHMPSYGVQAEHTNASRLMELLDRSHVPTADLFAAFRQQEQVLYFAHDSHWNTQGAALGADRINEAFGIDSHYYSGDFSQTQPHSGDLFTMLYPAFSDPESDLVYGDPLQYSFTSAATRPDAIVLNTQSSKPGSLLAYRDSFGNLLFPFLADSYGSCLFSRSTTYDLTKPSDYVLVELVERNLRYLTQNLPVMPAPQAQLQLPDTVQGTLQVTTAEKGELLQVKGSFPRLDAQSPVYILCDGVAYEAFCLGDTGFGLYLPQQAAPQYGVCQVDGSYILYEIEVLE